MNEPKRRGRPPKAALLSEPQAPNSVPAINGDADYAPVQALREAAQAYAMRVWNGQSVSLGRGDRIRRIKAALEGQGLSFDGVKLPGDADDDSEWTEDDEKPVTWRKAAS